MVEMKTEMQMEGGVTVSMKADKRALDVVVAFREKDGTESERLPFWLNAKEAEALGNALIAMAHASMTYGVKHEAMETKTPAEKEAPKAKETGETNPKYCSLTDLTTVCGLSKSTLNRLKAKCEDFPRPIKISQTYLYKLEEFRAWLDSHRD